MGRGCRHHGADMGNAWVAYRYLEYHGVHHSQPVMRVGRRDTSLQFPSAGWRSRKGEMPVTRFIASPHRRIVSMWALCIPLGLAACVSGSAERLGPSGGRSVVTRVEGDQGWNAPTTVSAEGSESSHTVQGSVEGVWAALQVVYDELEIPLAVVNAAGRYLGNSNFSPRRIAGQRLSRFLDCGYGMTATPLADEYRISMGVITRISPAEGGGTLLLTELVANADRRDASADPVRCATKGRLERMIAEMVAEQLGGTEG